MSGLLTEGRTDEVPRQPAERPPSWMEQAGASWRVAADDDQAENEGNKIRAYNALEDALVALGNDRARYNRPEWRSFLNTPETSPQRLDALWRDVEAARAKDPKYFADIPKTRAEFERWGYARQGQRAKDLATLDRGTSTTAQLLPQLGLGVLQAAQPENLPYMVMGGGSPTLPGLMAREFVANAQGAVVQTNITERSRANMGEAYDDAATDVLTAGASGAVLAGGLHVGGKAIGAIADRIDPFDRKVARAIEQAPLPDLPDHEVAARFSAAVPAEARTPDQQAALHVIDRQTEVDASNPYVRTPAAMDAHATQLQSMVDALLAARAGKVDDRRPVPASASPASRDATIRFVMDDLEGGEARVVDSGGVTRFGISQDAHPGVNVDTLTRPAAEAIYRKQYWEPLGLDNLDPQLAAVAFDTAINHGVGTARKMLAEAGGSVEKLLDLRRAEYARLIAANPAKYGRYEEGWSNRLAKLEERFGGDGADRGDASIDIADEGSARLDDVAPIAPILRSRAELAAAAYRVPEPPVGGRAPAFDANREDYTPPRATATLGTARTAAAEFVGMPIRNAETGLEATVSRRTLAKMTSASAALKSTSAVDHAMAVGNADRLFAAATLAERTPDARGEPTIAAISRYHAPMETPNGPVNVRMTVKETTSSKSPNPLYTIETISVDRAHDVEGRAGVEPGPEAPPSEAIEGGIERTPGQDRNAPRPGSTPDIVASPRDVDVMAAAPPDKVALAAFDDPGGNGAHAVAESLLHDLRAGVEAGDLDGATFRLDDGRERSAADILSEIDADDAAIEAARRCL